MTNPRPCKRHLDISRRATSIACGIVFTLATLAANSVAAQTYTVIHSFPAGGGGGAYPYGGLTIDRAGNLYGTTFNGGTDGCSPVHGCGTIFKIKNFDGQFSFEPLYKFLGGSDGATPAAALVISPSGVIYGSTLAGGGGNCNSSNGIPGCGTVFSVAPPPTPPRNISEWNETVLHAFQGPDGQQPEGILAVDQSGRIYGSTQLGGTNTSCSGIFGWCGVVFQLTPSSGGWGESVLYGFNPANNNDGYWPEGGVILDAAGNVYGTTYAGGGLASLGTVWQLVASSNWTENILHSFGDGSDGAYSASGLTFDSSGNLYGASLFGSSAGGGNGSVFELSSGSWAFNVLYGVGDTYGAGATLSPPIFDRAGNLYGTMYVGGAYNNGSVYKLTPSEGGWSYTSLHDFCAPGSNCSDGQFPTGSIVMDANGNLYGTTFYGGETGANLGVVWEITP